MRAGVGRVGTRRVGAGFLLGTGRVGPRVGCTGPARGVVLVGGGGGPARGVVLVGGGGGPARGVVLVGG